LEENSQDLIISNLPAKAGESVLQEFVNSSLTYLSAGGICVVVIVATLKDTILNAISKTDAEITYKEDTRDYSVYHFKKIKNINIEINNNGKTNLKECYIRGINDFQLNKLHYSLKAVYNLSGFDTIPYHIDLTAHLLEKQAISGRTLFWNPGQGHLPLISHLKNRTKITETILASRDILQLKISRQNLLDTLGTNIKETLELKHICCLEKLSKDILYDSIIISLEETDETILNSIQEIIAPNGMLIITGKSSYIAGTIKTNTGWILITSRKYRGFRVVVFKRNSGNY